MFNRVQVLLVKYSMLREKANNKNILHQNTFAEIIKSGFLLHQSYFETHTATCKVKCGTMVATACLFIT
jgi:hypothetical protein